MAEIAARSRRNAATTPRGARQCGRRSAAHEPYVATRCAATTCRRSPTALRRRARDRRQGPGARRDAGLDPSASTTASSPTARRCRALTESPSTRHAGTHAGVNGAAPVERRRAQATFSHQERLLREVLGLGNDVDVNPSGGRARREPRDGRRPRPDRRGGPRRRRAGRPPGASPHVDVRAVPAAEPRLRAGGWRMSRPAAIVGIGQTKHKKSPRRRVAARPRARGRAAPRSTTPSSRGPTSTRSSSARRPTPSRAS